MVPLTFLAGMLLLTLAASVVHLALRRRTARRLTALAATWGMQFAATDVFQISGPVVERFPIPGASDLIVLDLIYRQQADHYLYIFTIQYTEGVVRTKNRVSRAAAICEPRDRNSSVQWTPLTLAPRELSLVQQYKHLQETVLEGK